MVVLTGRDMRGKLVKEGAHNSNWENFDEDDEEPINLGMTPPNPQYMLPLMAVKGGGDKYVPWSRVDLESLIKKLPPIGKGAAGWINIFERETCQDKLALADIRTILIKVRAEGALMVAEKLARCSGKPDDTPFGQYRNLFWSSLKESFPSEFQLDALATIKIKDDESTHEYVTRAWELWEKGTGSRPDDSDLAQQHFRRGVLEGLPSVVQNKLKDIVGLNEMPKGVWMKNLDHVITRARQTDKDRQDSLTRKPNEKVVEQLVKAMEQATLRATAQALTGPTNPNHDTLMMPVLEY